ncbi:unnamed protein product [Euphydryas editha]|uniref:Uncharacterized protein n=1 Tax=Euphydryas editha TaxID=104508 RepID=A0AAU9U4G1_EUPED|nr:unnamed protein product [Euphydryas editha]
MCACKFSCTRKNTGSDTLNNEVSEPSLSQRTSKPAPQHPITSSSSDEPQLEPVLPGVQNRVCSRPSCGGSANVNNIVILIIIHLSSSNCYYPNILSRRRR